MKLYSYPRSSASYRVRIALHHKGLPFEIEPIDLLAGDQKKREFLELNPQGVLPTLVDGPVVISQSLAAIEYLEERHPRPPLLPERASDRARVRQLALVVACEIHPLQNLGVLRDLEEELGVAEPERRAWARGVIERGLQALEQLVARGPGGTFCHGSEPTLADLCLVPQLFNARRFECDLRHVPRLLEIEESCQHLEAFRNAAPEN
ncbi:MAG TPA: maleylacetoacetate isomerase [Deltaproteobacteria bacterium]|nr:maleylacetoacetate isomerase [Deltaproteobacteria bacterium]